MWHFHETRCGVSMRWDVDFHESWHFHEMNCSIYKQCDQLNSIQVKPKRITTTYLMNVTTGNLNLWTSAHAVCIPFCHAYYAFLLKFFSSLILLGKFLSICQPYYNFLEWCNWLLTMWVCPYSNGAQLNTNKRLNWLDNVKIGNLKRKNRDHKKST